MLVAGVVSDKLFHSKAQRTCALCMVGVMAFLIVFCHLPASTNPVVLMLVLACIGFFLYGPQALIGVVASNQVTRRGASSADNPKFGWEGVFKIMIFVAALGLVTLLTLWNKKTDGYAENQE